MSIRMLCDAINNVSTEAEAVEFYTSTMRGPMVDAVRGEPDAIQECGVTGFFICSYFNKPEDYKAADRQLQTSKAQWNSAQDPFPFTTDNEILRCNATGDMGHELTIIRQGKDIALFQSFVGRFYLFPALNNGIDYNVVGRGEEAQREIRRKLRDLEGVSNTYYVSNIPLEQTVGCLSCFGF